jgi:hypothetical protein
LPASRSSLRLTETYRHKAARISDRLVATAQLAWLEMMPGDLDQERWVAITTVRTAQAQRAQVRLAGAYLTSFVFTETGERHPVRLDSEPYVNVSRDGRALLGQLRSPMIAVRQALQEGASMLEALTTGHDRIRVAVGTNVDAAGRNAISDALVSEEVFVGWQRVLAGTCGACAGAAVGKQGVGLPFKVHPGCRCVQEPLVRGAAERFARPTGQQVFDGLTSAQQDEMLGAKAASAVRDGIIQLSSLVKESSGRAAEEANWITQGPVTDDPGGHNGR